MWDLNTYLNMVSEWQSNRDIRQEFKSSEIFIGREAAITQWEWCYHVKSDDTSDVRILLCYYYFERYSNCCEDAKLHSSR